MKASTYRRRALGLAFFAAALLVPATVQSRQAAQPPLQAAAEAIIGGGSDDWSVYAWSLDSKRPLFAVNADSILIPASNNKVFTAIWALEAMGADFRFPTDLLLPGPVPENGVVQGPVYLRGSGDPAFGYPEFEKDPMRPLRVMARQLKARGVRAVQGGVVADASVFDTLNYGPEWPADTGNGAAYYAPTVNGLPFQRNVLWLNVKPSPGGGPATFVREPDVPEIPVDNRARTGGSRGWAVRNPGQDTIIIKGGVSGRGPHRYPVGVKEASLLAGGALRQALREEGIQVAGEVRTGRVPEGAKLIHRHYSMPLARMIPKLNRDSDNFFAEHLWKAASAHSIGVGSYTRGGAASAKFFIQNAKVPYGQVWQADGSGLSSLNRASARALVDALVFADAQPWSRTFHESLAVGGDREGTLRRLFVGGRAQGNLHAKTGYIRGVRTLSGYVKTASGENVAFSFLYNGRNTSGARGVQTQLGNLLADYAGQ
ncbi:MAG TPA: D-alanyl-D-alanine carboxypeptidase/D-alanyl-D-alanine-endopeptidase [Longimicrobiaceae bacterium]|nr:D-alanyl-D-alanine carboxypeptidase/D-alanyl-D-alanine-endopeptidase [Longimicrobiaceae bacterium]